MKTLQQLASDALAVQDACNLSGVAHGFARAMSALGDLGLDSVQKNTHPIAIVWADKIAHLTGTQNTHGGSQTFKVSQAFHKVHEIAEGSG